MIPLPYGRQWVGDADIAAVSEVLRSELITTGPKAQEFEECFARKVGAKHAVAVNSATAALHLAMRVAGIQPGHRVITSPNTFLASANCAAFVGATPDFADIDPVSFNLDPAALEQAWRPDTKAVVAVAYAGQACNMPAIAQIARRHRAILIEDACHGVGGGFVQEDRTWKLGGHPWADMTVFSFHPVKTMTTGEGGMLVTDNEEWAIHARQLRSHGIVRAHREGLGVQQDAEFSEHGPWYYEMLDLGYNYRITDFQCALGLSQLKQLETFIRRRREIVAYYNEALADIPWLITPHVRCAVNKDCISWHLYTTQMDFHQLGKSRTQVMAELAKEKIGTQVLYIPVYLQPWYRKTYGYSYGKCPVAENYYRHALSLPLYPAMTDDDVRRVVNAVRALAE